MKVSAGQKFIGVVTFILGILTLPFIGFMSLFVFLSEDDIYLTTIGLGISGIYLLIKGSSLINYKYLSSKIVPLIITFHLFAITLIFFIKYFEIQDITSILVIFFVHIPIDIFILLKIINQKKPNPEDRIKEINFKHYLPILFAVLFTLIFYRVPIGGPFHRGLFGIYYQKNCLRASSYGCVTPRTRASNVDYFSFEVIEPSDTSKYTYNYAKDKNHVYAHDYSGADYTGGGVHIVEGADPNSFEFLKIKKGRYEYSQDELYFIDKNYIFLNGKKIGSNEYADELIFDNQ